ncbi:hypothetical protein HDU76_001161 [Blyttiomyces sp. JEL0837]|nr:hypothetical protein HDU76_001161 [Blyttiomyces sp. JEL0837]
MTLSSVSSLYTHPPEGQSTDSTPHSSTTTSPTGSHPQIDEDATVRTVTSISNNVKSFLAAHVLFQNLDESFLKELAESLQSRIYNPREYIIRKGEIGRAMFFIVRGEVEVVSEDEKLGSVLKDYPEISAAISMKAEERYAIHMKQIANAQKIEFENEVNIGMTHDDLRKIPLFRDCDVEFLHKLTLSLQPMQYQQNDLIIKEGDIANEMFFVVAGTAEVFGEKDGHVYAEFQPGSFFGEVGLFFQIKRTASVRCASSMLTVFVLDKTDLDEVLDGHPEIDARIKAEARVRYDYNMARQKAKLNTKQEAATEVDVVRETLKIIPLFKGGSVAFFHELALALKLKIFEPNQVIITKGDVGSSMFFVVDGVAEVVSEDLKTVFGEIPPNSFFGEVALFYQIDRTATVRSRTLCTLFELEKSALESILGQHPKLKETMVGKAKENYRLWQNRQKAISKLGQDEKIRFDEEATVELLKKVPLFKDCNVNFLREIARNTSVHRHHINEWIFRSGEKSVYMFLIVSGKVEIVSDDGSTVFDTVDQGGFFGEVGLLHDIARMASVRVASTNCDLIGLSKKTIKNVLTAYPDSYHTIAIEAEKRFLAMQSRQKGQGIGTPAHSLFPSPQAKNEKQSLGMVTAKKLLVGPFASMSKKKSPASAAATKSGESSAASSASSGTSSPESQPKGNNQNEVPRESENSLEAVSKDSLADAPVPYGSRSGSVTEGTDKTSFGKFIGNLTKPLRWMEDRSKVAPTPTPQSTATPTSKDKAQLQQHQYAHKSQPGKVKAARTMSTMPTKFIALILGYLNPKERFRAREILDDEVAYMVSLCPNISELSLSNCWKLTDRAVSSVGHGLANLKSLDISFCGQISGIGLFDHNLSELESLTLKHSRLFSDANLENVLCRAPRLKKLRLKRCTKITDNGVFAIVRYCRQIAFLDLSDCDRISDKCLKWIASGCTQLTSLQLSFCTRITNTGLYDLALGQQAFEFLDFSHCEQITDAGIIFFSNSLRCLRRLSLRRCNKITDGVAIFLAKNAPLIEWVDLTGCPNITSTSVKSLIISRPKIKVIADTSKESRGIKSPEDVGKQRAQEVLFKEVFTSGPAEAMRKTALENGVKKQKKKKGGAAKTQAKKVDGKPTTLKGPRGKHVRKESLYD